jgi:hypothetical protein
MTSLAALALNLAIAAAIFAAGWCGLNMIPMEPPDRSRFRAALVLIAVVIGVNLLFGFDSQAWWPIWARFE